MKKSVLAVVLAASSLFAGSVLACGGDGSGQHIGKVMEVNPQAKTFTIQDMETRSPVTFNANDTIIAAVQKRGGAVQVHYEEDDDGALKAVGVNF